MEVKIDNLSSSVQAELEKYSTEVAKKTHQAIKSVAMQTRKTLSKTSPKRSGRYQKGWAVRVSTDISHPNAVIYNKDRYFLTHLLENPHRARNGRAVTPKKHIDPAEEQAARILTQTLIEELEK